MALHATLGAPMVTGCGHTRPPPQVAASPHALEPGAKTGLLPSDSERVAVALVTSLAARDAKAAMSSFDETMRTKLPADKLLAVWQSVEENSGAFRGIERVVSSREQGYAVEKVLSRMDRARVTVKVVFDASGQIAGLFFRPGDATAEWQPPPYANPALFSERAVTVGALPGLPGILAMPRFGQGESAVPGLVLVHGSGPSNRDEELGGTKVFRDLAYGLATRGIAVLRYDKRTLVAPGTVTTQKDEVIDDALSAIRLLRATPGIDPTRIVVAGHSQGGALAPRIASVDGALAGVVVLSGPVRPIQDSLIAQFAYLHAQRPQDANLASLSDQAMAFKLAIESPELKADTPVHVPGGGTIPGAYFIDARGYRPEQVAASLRCPVLVVQGGRDYQVTMGDDFAAWQKGLEHAPRAVFKSYPSLDHRLVAGNGLSTPDQYVDPAHVDGQLVGDVAAWILAIPPPK